MRHYTVMMRDLRENQKLTQKEVAAWLHVGQKTYSDYETGKTRIPVDSLIILAKRYHVSMDYICGLSEDTKTVPDKINRN